MNILKLVLYILEVYSVAFDAFYFALGASQVFYALSFGSTFDGMPRLGYRQPLEGVVLEKHLIEEAVQRSHLREVLIVGLGASSRVDADVVAFPEHLQDRLSEDVLMLDR